MTKHPWLPKINLRPIFSLEIIEYPLLFMLLLLTFMATKLGFNFFHGNATNWFIGGLSIALLRIRNGQLELLHKRFLSKDDILLSDYPRDFGQKIDDAQKLYLVGSNLRRIFQQGRTQHLETMLGKGGHITALLVSPTPPDSQPEAWKFCIMQEAAVKSTKYSDLLCNDRWLKGQWDQITANIRTLEHLKQIYPDQIEIKTINYPLSYGIDAIDFDSWNGTIYIRYYPFRESGRPILVLKPGDTLYDFYRRQTVELVESGDPA
jgi:hypothetical protein